MGCVARSARYYPVSALLIFAKLPEDNPKTHILIDDVETYLDRDYALRGLSEGWLKVVGMRRDAQHRLVWLYNLAEVE